MRFLVGKSYVWIFWVFFLVFIAAGAGLTVFVGHPVYAGILLPIVLGIVFALEIRSGVVLDSWWRAKYVKGTWQYKAILAWHATALVIFIVMMAIFIGLCRTCQPLP